MNVINLNRWFHNLKKRFREEIKKEEGSNIVAPLGWEIRGHGNYRSYFWPIGLNPPNS
jgi:hypothetical protein